jgi:hypothetical protein
VDIAVIDRYALDDGETRELRFRIEWDIEAEKTQEEIDADEKARFEEYEGTMKVRALLVFMLPLTLLHSLALSSHALLTHTHTHSSHTLSHTLSPTLSHTPS